MEERKTYSEKLKDPRWQKKRLEIFERDNWMCQVCNDKTTTLVVHHKYYESGKEPWEASDDALITRYEIEQLLLCELRKKFSKYFVYRLTKSIERLSPGQTIKIGLKKGAR